MQSLTHQTKLLNIILTVQSTVIDYGSTPILAGDQLHITLPNEGINSDFRVLSVEYNVDGKTQTLETTLELGREKPLLADYMYALKSRTERLCRVKKSEITPIFCVFPVFQMF